MRKICLNLLLDWDEIVFIVSQIEFWLEERIRKKKKKKNNKGNNSFAQTNDIIEDKVRDRTCLVYFLAIYVINQSQIRPIIYQDFRCYQIFQGQAGVGKIPQKEWKKRKTREEPGQSDNKDVRGIWSLKMDLLEILLPVVGKERVFFQQILLPKTIFLPLIK